MECVKASRSIYYDAKSVWLDGSPLFCYSAAFHYFRTPPELWRDRFAKIRTAGFNTVETYVPWNFHEALAPSNVDDFSQVDLSMLQQWTRMAHEEFELYTIIRPGPYVCAEWDGGGLPRWLFTKAEAVDKTSAWMRSDNPTYLLWVQHWFRAVLPQVASEQVTRKPFGQKGTILFQIENEYDLCTEPADPSRRIAYLAALHTWSKEAGIDVPIFTCKTREALGGATQGLRGVFDVANLYPNDEIEESITELTLVRRSQPHAPLMVSELQGGWFSMIGMAPPEEHAALSAEQLLSHTALCIESGATMLNYYMLVGGTNFGMWASRGVTASYNFAAPISEHGGLGAKFAAVQAIGRMVQQHGEALAQSDRLSAQVICGDPEIRASIRGNASGELFVFVRNGARQQPRRGELCVRLEDKTSFTLAYELRPFSTNIFYKPANLPPAQGTWLLGMAETTLSPAPSTAAEQAMLPIRQILTRSEDETGPWQIVPPHTLLPAMGVLNSRAVIYRTIVVVSEDQARNFDTLQLAPYYGDETVVRLNGSFLPVDDPNVIPVAGRLHSGENRIEVLYNQVGQAKIGPAIADEPGIRGGGVGVRRDLGHDLLHWKARLLAPDESAETLGGAVNDHWQAFTLDRDTIVEVNTTLIPGSPPPRSPNARILFGRKQRAAFQTSFIADDSLLSRSTVNLSIERVRDACEIYVNGKRAGNTVTRQLSWRGDIRQILRLGSNVVTVIVNGIGGEAGLLGAVRLQFTPGLPLNEWELCPDLRGMREQWFGSTAAPTGWKACDLDPSVHLNRFGYKPTPSRRPITAFATWYRLEFPGPAAALPLRALLEATGNGHVFLNGHALGRYWQAGPQREFYLPEPWIILGPASRNVLTLCLLPVESHPELRNAWIGAYPLRPLE